MIRKYEKEDWFDFSESIELNELQKNIDKLWKEYFDLGFKDFNTWEMDKKEILMVLKECIKNKKSYEQIYGENKYSKNTDY